MEDAEPFFIRETSGVTEPDSRLSWISGQADQARADGAVLFRATVHEAQQDRLLFEAWKFYPADQGEPRWGKATT